MKQVDSTHYRFNNYATSARFVSYYYQLRCLLDSHPQSVLEIGVGDGLIGDYLRRNTSVHYQNLDIDADLRPSIVGSILAIPLPDKSVDSVCAFQVLEHLPFEQFEPSLLELTRVARKHVLISLPHHGIKLQIHLKLPLLPLWRSSIKLPWPKPHIFDGQHHWEIGKKGYSTRRIRKILRTLGILEQDFRPFENQYHHFFVLRLEP